MQLTNRENYPLLYYSWLRHKFEAADKDRNGALNFDEVCTLITNLNLKLDKKRSRNLFNVSLR